MVLASVTPPYQVVKQQPYCCVPACLSMVLDRRGIPHPSQEAIGYELGLTVPADAVHFFTNVRTGDRPIAGYGTQVAIDEFSINEYFKRNNIQLREQYYAPAAITNAQELLVENIIRGNDTIACFNSKALDGIGDYGHVVLVQSVEGETLTIVDPASNMPSVRTVTLSALLHAIEVHSEERRAGFWILRST